MGFVYILANERRGTLYIGVTSNLLQRIYQHKEDVIPGFTKKYNVKCLVWWQEFPTMRQAIEREKQLKEWKRSWKISLIEDLNPDWWDLYPDLIGDGSRLSPG